MLRSTYSDYRPDDRKDYVALFASAIDEDQLVTWLAVNRGRRPASEEFHLERDVSSYGLVRNTWLEGSPHIFNGWREEAEGEAEIECLPLLKRRNFLHRSTLSARSMDRAYQENKRPLKARLFPIKTCIINLLPFKQTRHSLFIPVILQHVEMVIVANQLCKTVIADVPFKNPYNVIEAINASST
jgi:hypothetical protein